MKKFISCILSFIVVAIVFAQNEINTAATKPKSDSIEIESHHYNSFFISYNDYSLKKRKAFYQNILGVYSNVSYGISNEITATIGFTPFIGWIGLKAGVPVIKNRLNLGASTLFLTSRSVSVINFISVTLGPKQANITLGAGGFFKSEVDITLKGMLMVTPRIYLFSENYFLGVDSSTNTFISISGSRFVSKNNRVSIELGLISIPEICFEECDDKVIKAPLIGFTLPLNRR